MGFTTDKLMVVGSDKRLAAGKLGLQTPQTQSSRDHKALNRGFFGVSMKMCLGTSGCRACFGSQLNFIPHLNVFSIHGRTLACK